MYIYPQLETQLKFYCNPSTYLDMISGLSFRRRAQNRFDQAYENILPLYVYAECPYCYTKCMEKIDTYSIMPGRMQFSLNTGSVLPKDYPQNYEVPCNHYLGVHTFLNLHNNIPIETRPFNNIAGEIPYITPWLLPDDIPAQAIIHALPICRVVNDVFIPSYTQFIISYFSLAPRLILDTHYANERKISEEDSEYYPRTVLLPHSYPNTLSDRIIKILQRDGVLPLENQQDPFDGYVHNLSLWARNGNLGYLDYSQKTLDLKIGVNLALPNLYLDIKGKGYAYSWNNNKIQPL